ncbi:MAG: OmpA family protein, partial [Bacteroidota bacterium]
AVRDYLVNQGVDTDALTPQGYGEAEPIADNDTAEGRARNRRVVFSLRAR